MVNKKPLHILIQCNELPPHSTGGIGIQSLNMAYALHQAGHRVTVVGLYNEYKAHSHPFRFVQLRRIKKLNFLGDLLNIFRFHLFLFYFIKIKKHRVDLIEYPDYESYGFFQLVGVPRLVRANDPNFYIGGKYYGAKWYQWIKRLRWLMERRAIRKADRVVVVAKYLVPIIEKLTGRKDIYCIYNMTRVGQGQSARYSHRAGKAFVLNTGTVAAHKGIPLLIDAFEEVADEVDFDLVLAGRIVQGIINPEAIRQRFQNRKNKIIFLGELHQKELMQVVLAAEAIIFPSLQENMPLAWCEAMGLGKAIWVSDIPAARELITHGVHGYIFERGRVGAIRKALLQINKCTEEELLRVGARARERYGRLLDMEVLLRENVLLFSKTLGHRNDQKL